MNSQISWIKLPVNFYKLPELQHIAAQPRGKNIVALYPRLLCLAGQLNAKGCFVMNEIPFTTKMLANELQVSKKTMEEALFLFKQFGLIDNENGTFFIPMWDIWQSADRLDKIREQDRLRKRKQRENARLAKCEMMWSVRDQVTENPPLEEE